MLGFWVASVDSSCVLQRFSPLGHFDKKEETHWVAKKSAIKQVEMKDLNENFRVHEFILLI